MVTPIREVIVPWPSDIADRYRQAGYWEGRSLGSHIWEQADRTPSSVAVVDGATRLTYADLVLRADAAATRLSRLGIRSGDRILVQLPNGSEFVVLTLACLRSGVVPVMALPNHRRHELTYLAEHAEAVAVAVPAEFRGFDHESLAHELRAEVALLRHVLVAGHPIHDASVTLGTLLGPDGGPGRPREHWDDHQPDASSVAVLLLSGGTTGLPKLIARTHDDYAYNAKRSAQVCGFGPDTTYLASLPAGHNFPLACPGILGALLVGGRVVMLDSSEPSRAFATMKSEAVTHTAVVPAVAQRWIDHAEATGHEVPSLRVLQVGGARLAPEIARKVRPTLGCTLQQVFGMAEGLLNYTRLDDPDDVIVETQGRPMSLDDEVLLVDERGQPVPCGAPGALLTRGPYTPRGYYRAPDHNAKAFTTDGWYRSGDICRWHPTGNLVVEGRDKDMINRGGEKISAEEIENLVYQSSAVEIVAAVAMPDPLLGERVCLYVVARPGATVTRESVRASLAERGVATYKLPDRVVTVAELPTTKIGKIDKKALREDIAARVESEQADTDLAHTHPGQLRE